MLVRFQGTPKSKFCIDVAFGATPKTDPHKGDAVFIFFRGPLAIGGACESLSDCFDLQFSQPL
jgi:hypothetical protein